ncbi:hypothetical protein FPRO03_07139 [Fusarium proliferatum]|nr:hypothetical protein FPRO03_07139 [Fusarium proliferatum]
MVSNNSQDPFERRVLVEKTSSSYAIRSELIGVIHGHVGETKKPATLLVLIFRFENLKKNVRIKSANITVEFYGDDGYPTIAAMAPYDEVKAHEITFIEETLEQISLTTQLGNGSGGSPRTAVVKKRKSSVVVTGSKFRRGNAVNRANLLEVATIPNVANWTIVEDPISKDGVLPFLQTAILLERTTEEIFKANINISVDVAGFSLRGLQDGLLESEDDPASFDPGASPLIPERLAGQNLDDLGSIDLSQLCVLGSIYPDPYLWKRKTMGQTIKDIVSDGKPREGKSVNYEVKASFIDLWDDKFSAADRHKLDTPLGRKDLNKYFSWISESANAGELRTNPQGIPEAQEVQQDSRNAHFCNLVAIQSSASKLTTFEKLEGLLNQPSYELLSDLFDLPPDFPVTQQHDRGGCEIFKGDRKASKLYIIQTPFYSTGFWSLLLYTMADSNVAGTSIKQAGLIQVDADINLTDIFSKVRQLVERHGHHQTLLPFQLFVSHYEATKEAIKSIEEEVSKADVDLFKHLKQHGKPNDAT